MLGTSHCTPSPLLHQQTEACPWAAQVLPICLATERARLALDGFLLLAKDGTQRSPSGSGDWRDRRGSPAEGGRRNPAQPLGLRPACRGRKVDAAQERARWRVVVVLRQGAGVDVVSLLAPGQPKHLVRGQRLLDDGPDSLRCSLSHCRAAARRAPRARAARGRARPAPARRRGAARPAPAAAPPAPRDAPPAGSPARAPRAPA